MRERDRLYVLGAAAERASLGPSDLRIGLAVQLSDQQAEEVIRFLDTRPALQPMGEEELAHLLMEIGATHCLVGERVVRAAAKQDRGLQQAVRRLRHVVRVRLNRDGERVETSAEENLSRL